MKADEVQGLLFAADDVAQAAEVMPFGVHYSLGDCGKDVTILAQSSNEAQRVRHGHFSRGDCLWRPPCPLAASMALILALWRGVRTQTKELLSTNGNNLTKSPAFGRGGPSPTTL